MPERKRLSADVMKEFVKNPDKATPKAEPSPQADQAPTPAPKNESKGQSDLTASVLDEFKKKDAERKVRITVDLFKSRHKKLKSIAGELETDMSTLVRTLIDKFIDEVDSQ